MPSTLLDRMGWHFLPLAAGDVGELDRSLGDLERRLLQGAAPRDLMRGCAAAFGRRREAPYAAVIAGQSSEDLRREVAAMRPGLVQVMRSGKDWETPRGSYFTPRPLGRRRSVVFVYPGVETPYPGMGRDLLALFPDLAPRILHMDPGFGELIQVPAAGTDQRGTGISADLCVGDDNAAMFEASVGFATLVTLLLRDIFGIQPQAACGFSLGELSMLWALGATAGAAYARQTLRRSPLFATRLVGPREAAREYLGLSPDAFRDDPDWRSLFILKAPADAVRAALRGEPAVFLTRVNAPGEVGIRGLKADCLRVIARLGCEAQGEPAWVLHCLPVLSEFQRLVELNTLPVRDAGAVRFYASALMGTMPATVADRARVLATNVCEPVDFPPFVDHMYGDGHGIFIEVGPHAACTAWIDTILQGREHVALAMHRRNVPDHRSILRALARLHSHRVPLDLSPLFSGL